MIRMRVLVMGLVLALMPCFSPALPINQLRQLAAKHNITCMLVFGDSSVDSGNNNRLATDMKSNFLPYGKDFFNGRPTGRFTNGRLATDFIGNSYSSSNYIINIQSCLFGLRVYAHGFFFQLMNLASQTKFRPFLIRTSVR